MTQHSGTALVGSAASAAAPDNWMHFIPARRASSNPAPGRSLDERARRMPRARRQRQALETFEQMLLTSRAKFVAMAYSILRNKEDAEDAVQNAFLSAYLHLPTFEGRAALRTWFTRIVLNAALMLRRKRKPSLFVPLADAEPNEDLIFWKQIPASAPDPEKAYADEEALQGIDTELAKMRPALRQAFTMTYYGELSNQEACQVLDIPIGTFKARVFRARRLVVGAVSTRKRKLISSTSPQHDSRLEAQAFFRPAAA